MNYPVWDLFYAGGGLPIALMAVIHVYVAHFAVGGGLFLVYTEYKAYREDSPQILDYVRRHTFFFLLLSTAFGGLTGVGIWFTISLLNPAATSILTHDFVFGWATEWVFFLTELVALFIYHYNFDKMDRKSHLIIGVIYFISAWLSLFVVNGIISFMLSPGEWLATGSFWDGFFNPTFFPSLFLRTFLAFVIAGVFGFLTAVMIRDKAFRTKMVRYCAVWLVLPYVFMVLSGIWYFKALPPEAKGMILGGSPELPPLVQYLLILTPVLFFGGLAMTARLPLRAARITACIVVVIGLFHMGSFEWIREAARRPWLISGMIYSNSVHAKDYAGFAEEGILKTAKWIENRELTDENQLAAGKEIFRLACFSCHANGGAMNDILPLTKGYTLAGMEAVLTGMGGLNDYMPPFPGTDEEKGVLARYIVESLHGRKAEAEASELALPEVEAAAFDGENGQYVLLAWSNLGMTMLSDADSRFSLMPPGNDLTAQLILRDDELPEVVTEGVEISYKIEKGFETPSKQVDFWKYVSKLFGRNIPENKGLTGNGLSGTMALHENGNAFTASKLPVVPYSDTGAFNPYPVIEVTAKEIETGKILARTKTTVPVSTEMGCRNCHGGNWKVNGVTGISDETASDILAAHDKTNGTKLLAKAKSGTPANCRSCHEDPRFGSRGNKTAPGLSSAIHGKHAGFLEGTGDQSCHMCHPSSPMGSTKSFRGRHAEMFDCTECHGSLRNHALSLAEYDLAKGKTDGKRAEKLRTEGETVNPRKAWVEQPDCLSCHAEYDISMAEETEPFNRWEKEVFHTRRDEMDAVMCAACHGSPHAIFPVEDSVAGQRDNLRPLQYIGEAETIGKDSCKVCHMAEMDSSGHHPNQLDSEE